MKRQKLNEQLFGVISTPISSSNTINKSYTSVKMGKIIVTLIPNW